MKVVNNMKLPDLKKVFSHRASNKYQSFSIMKPHHDWRIIIIIFISVTIMLIAVSFYFWDKIRKEDILEINKDLNAQSSLINQELLNKTILRFKERENRINSFPKGTVLNLDPNK